MDGCLNNKHFFQDVYLAPEKFGTYVIVRWCIRCGALKIDLDHADGSIEGGVLPLTLPQYIWIAKESEKKVTIYDLDDI